MKYASFVIFLCLVGCQGLTPKKQVAIAAEVHASASDTAVFAIENCLRNKRIKQLSTQPCLDAGDDIDAELDGWAAAIIAAEAAVTSGLEPVTSLDQIIRALETLEAALAAQLTPEQRERLR